MGKHWVDPTSDEFTGKGFSRTFLYGSYNGPITFYEPIITLEYLPSKTETVLAIKQLAEYPKAGFYPKGYNIRYNESSGEYLIALDNLKMENN